MILGSSIMARAIASICCSPPDRVPPAWWRRSPKREKTQTPCRATRSCAVADAVAVESDAQIFHHCQQAEDAAVFRHIADAAMREFVRGHAGDVFALKQHLAGTRCTRPMMVLSVVLLPTPLRPKRPTTSPAPTCSVTPSRMWLLP
jgi:hypothetical protein